jgi:hypothetical protein
LRFLLHRRERNVTRNWRGRLDRIVDSRLIGEHWRVIRGWCRGAFARGYDGRDGRRNSHRTIGLWVRRNQPNQHDQNRYRD